MDADPRAAAVVVNYGSHRLLDRNLGGLSAAVRVVVVDNYSGAAERAAVTALAAERGWELVTPDANTGFGVGVNLGAARAAELGASALLLVNPDAVVDAATASALVEHVRAHPDDLVTPRIVDSAGVVWFAGSEIELRTGFLRLPGASAETAVQPWLSAACLAVSTPLFDRLGGFATDYFLYWEDVDLSFRAAAAGATLVVRHDLTAVHDEGGTHDTSAGPAKSPLYYRWNARNRLLFAARNLPTRLLLRWLLATPAQSWQILLRGGRRQLVQSPRPLLAIVRGSLGGIGVAVGELARRAAARLRPGRGRDGSVRP